MQNQTILTIPCHWDEKVINKIDTLPRDNGVVVGEVYGALAKGGPVGHGRSSESVVNTSVEDALKYRDFLRSKGMKLTYLLNAPFKMKGDAESKKLLHEYLDWILNGLRPDALTIASLELMEEVRKFDQEIGIHISTIAGVRSASDLYKYLHVRPDRVVPHHDLGKDWKSLYELACAGEVNGIGVELLATESCLLHCPSRQAHYEHLAGQGPKDSPFHTSCNTKKLIHPREFLLAGGVIRPEDVHIYEELGVKYIKLTGRSKPAEWLPEVAEAYLNRSYDGNLIRLLGIDPSLKAEDWIYLNNRSLDGFINNFPIDSDYGVQSDYCDQWMIKLYSEGSFEVRDKTIYSTDGGCLSLCYGGEQANQIISKERR